METIFIEVTKILIPLIGTLIVLWFAQKRAKSLGTDAAAKEYEETQARLKAALKEDLAETRADFLQCKDRLIAAENTIVELRNQVNEQDQIIFNLRLDISALQKINIREGRKSDGPA